MRSIVLFFVCRSSVCPERMKRVLYGGKIHTKLVIRVRALELRCFCQLFFPRSKKVTLTIDVVYLLAAENWHPTFCMCLAFRVGKVYFIFYILFWRTSQGGQLHEIFSVFPLHSLFSAWGICSEHPTGQHTYLGFVFDVGWKNAREYRRRNIWEDNVSLDMNQGTRSWKLKL